MCRFVYLYYLYTSVNLITDSILELIIDEQVEKLNATLRGIETLSVVARDTASKLTELIASDEVCNYIQVHTRFFRNNISIFLKDVHIHMQCSGCISVNFYVKL